MVFTTSPPCNEHEIFYLINVTKGHLEAVEGVSVKYDLSQPNTLSATRSEGECTAALFRNTQGAHLCTSSAQQWYTSVTHHAFFALLTTASSIICGCVTIPHVHVCV